MSGLQKDWNTMTEADYLEEHRVIYAHRLALLGCYGAPTAEQHNMAVQEADEHIKNLRLEDRHDAMKELIELRDKL